MDVEIVNAHGRSIYTHPTLEQLLLDPEEFPVLIQIDNPEKGIVPDLSVWARDTASTLATAHTSSWQVAGIEMNELRGKTEKPRHCALRSAALVEQACEVVRPTWRTALHVTCRDWTAEELIIAMEDLKFIPQTIVVITGDPPDGMTDADFRRSLRQDVVGFISTLSAYRRQKNLRFAISVAFNQNAADIALEQTRLKRKLAAGANIIAPQPVFSMQQAQDLHSKLSWLADQVPVMPGVWPVASQAQASMLMRNIPGVIIPAELQEQLPATHNAALETQLQGLQIAKQFLDQLRRAQLCGGAYLVAPGREPLRSVLMLNGI